MAFESLSCRHVFTIADLPHRWLPLIHLYDPDLPLFPVYYFHTLPDLPKGHRPALTERAFGYIEKVNLTEVGAEVTVVTNKNLSLPSGVAYLDPVRRAVRERLGLETSVTISDIKSAFMSPLDYANDVLVEIWHRVVDNAYGNRLPFGRLWDEVLGLTRFVASWNPQSGRKGELIQTHYFASRFGVRIQSSGNIPQVDFFLLPTIQELLDTSNPLTGFPQFADLVETAHLFQSGYCSLVELKDLVVSKFENPGKGKFNTEGLLGIIAGRKIPYQYRPSAIECFNAFGKGPQRTVIYLMLLDDIRKKRIDIAALTPEQCGSIYDGLGGTYQSPKVIEIYAQQSFGNPSAMPIDTWIDTFLKWPLRIYPTNKMKNVYQYIFSHSCNLGKVERLLWVAGQARKVHSSACNDALWCLKYDSEGRPRGANPLACNICLQSVRNTCPAYAQIKQSIVAFNKRSLKKVDFIIQTSAHNNKSSDQAFVSCEGYDIYGYHLSDDFSPADAPYGFAPYPSSAHHGENVTVETFVNTY